MRGAFPPLKSWIVVLLAALVCIPGPIAARAADDTVGEQVDRLGARLDALAEELELIRRLNDLQLTIEQVQALQAVAQQVEAAATPILAERLGVLQRLEPLMVRQRELAVADQPDPDELQAQLQGLWDELSGLDERMDKTVGATAPALRQILTAPQVSIVTGAEDARIQTVTLLQTIRDMPQAAFDARGPLYAEQLAHADAGPDADQIVDLFRAARALTPDEFRQQQSELASALLPIYAPSEEDANNILAQFFAHPGMAKILEDKLAALKNQG